jgi:alkylated DNA repair dioxygenase AlkB
MSIKPHQVGQTGESVGQLSFFEIAQTQEPAPSNEDEVQFVQGFLGAREADFLFDYLKNLNGWKQDVICIFGQARPLPRLHRWFAHSGQPYRWSGIEMIPEPFPDVLGRILDALQEERGIRFNTALGNLYRDGMDSVAWHSDDEPELGPNPVIASLSLGATRRFLMRKKSDHKVVRSYELGHGSLLWMAGSTQAHWEHAIPKTKQKISTRINLTFRAIYS